MIQVKRAIILTDSEKMIYNLVYDYYETRILMGASRYGDYLPAITRIGESFQMAPRTVRAALTRLEENGYIRIDPRKPARVIYQITDEEIRENAASYFVPRQAGILDFCLSGKLLIEPIWEYVQTKLDQETWLQLKQMIAVAGNIDLSVSTRLHIYAFAALHNRLIMNFYWELLRYLRFPYLSSQDAHKVRDNQFLEDEKADETGFMRDAFEGDFEKGVNYLFAFCSRVENDYNLKGKEEIPFHWNVYWQRPQICYTLASGIILDIIKGTYPVGGYLPSLSILSKQLNVSFRTLRRTLSILDSLGVIRLHQGKVSEICTEIRAIDFDRPEVREGFRYYRESLQFMAITVRPVFLYTIEHVKEEERDHLLHEFMHIFNENKYRWCFQLTFDFIREFCPLAAVRECYNNLAYFLIWGYPFILYYNGKDALTEDYISRCQRAASCLEQRQWEGFADCWRELEEREQKEADRYLSEYDI